MIKIEKQMTYGWEEAIRGMRNPMNSWEKSDSEIYEGGVFEFTVGPNDLNLMTKLRNAGTDHRKFMRMITVYVDICAPLYWWKEFDTYKVGTVANSCSTMHKIHAKPIELSDFSFEDFDLENVGGTQLRVSDLFINIVADCECLRKMFLETKDRKYWRALIQLLPESYNQKRTVMLNYEVLANMYHSRKNHKLDEWRDFCKWVESLPYSELITAPYAEPAPVPKVTHVDWKDISLPSFTQEELLKIRKALNDEIIARLYKQQEKEKENERI